MGARSGCHPTATDRRSRYSCGAPVDGLVPALIFLVVLLVFIFQNLHNVKISFFTASGSFPLALALLLAAVGGALIVLCLGSIRILQLRRTVRRRSLSG